MTQEEKQLLLKDLCAREPYHPKIQVFNQGYEGFQDGEFDTNLWLHHIDAFRFDRIEILPYLRPMSSMTEEEKKKMQALYHENTQNVFKDPAEIRAYRFYDISVVDWLNKKGFDYRGLIPMNLALEAPKDMYKTE